MRNANETTNEAKGAEMLIYNFGGSSVQSDFSTLKPEERQVVESFVSTAREQGYKPTTSEQVPCCGIWLKGEAAKCWGVDIPCFATFQDELGNWGACFRSPHDGSMVTRQFFGDVEVW